MLCIVICIYLFCTIPEEADNVMAISKLADDGTLVPVVLDEPEGEIDTERPRSEIYDETTRLLAPSKSSIN
jgi:hypothetical protein